MGFKSAKNTHNVNQSNGKYEVGGITFYSKFVYENIKSIDEYLRLLYSADYGIISEIIKNSNVRNDEKYFDEILGGVEERIERIMKIGGWCINDLYKEKYAYSFFEKFRGIYNCFIEYEFLDGEYKNNFERRIIDIKLNLGLIGIDQYFV